MKYLIIVLILLSFLQTTILPINLVLLLILCRAFLVDEKVNFYLAFSFGLLLSFLTNSPLGLMSLVFLTGVVLVSILKRSPVLATLISILITVGLLLGLYQLVDGLIYKQQFSWIVFFAQLVLIIPVYIGLSLWEERFVVKSQVKLKLGK